jgi:predicted nucleic acid-binding protein
MIVSASPTMVDTTVLIDHLRGVNAAGAFLAALEAPPYASELTRTEVMIDLRSAERIAAERLFAHIEWIPVGERIARDAGELGRRFRRSHHLGVTDLVIGATAQLLGAALATHNVKHYPMLADLRPPY